MSLLEELKEGNNSGRFDAWYFPELDEEAEWVPEDEPRTTVLSFDH